MRIFRFLILACISAPALSGLVDCRNASATDFFGGSPVAANQQTPKQSGGSAHKVYDWRETARLEHDDRRRRFQRLAREGQIASPLFLESLLDGTNAPSLAAKVPILRMVYPEAVFFDTAKSDVLPSMDGVLQVIARAMRSDAPDVAVFVVGHTDARGGDDYNFSLSVDRAESVARRLYSLGIGSVRLWRVGFGKAVPIAPNDTAANMARNRRVEFIFAARAEAIAIWLSQQSVTICDGLDPGFRDQCKKSVTSLPPVRAEPVLDERKQTTASLGSRETATVDGGRDLVVTGTAKPYVTTSPSVARAEPQVAAPKAIVTIEKASPVVIDLREQRVIVGAPIL
jgi:outer membrane protein OmpA-like peptidoglycan-associated protein